MNDMATSVELTNGAEPQGDDLELLLAKIEQNSAHAILTVDAHETAIAAIVIDEAEVESQNLVASVVSEVETEQRIAKVKQEVYDSQESNIPSPDLSSTPKEQEADVAAKPSKKERKAREKKDAQAQAAAPKSKFELDDVSAESIIDRIGRDWLTLNTEVGPISVESHAKAFADANKKSREAILNALAWLADRGDLRIFTIYALDAVDNDRDSGISREELAKAYGQFSYSPATISAVVGNYWKMLIDLQCANLVGDRLVPNPYSAILEKRRAMRSASAA